MLDTEEFTIGAAATRASDRIIYNDTTGALFFDPDGTGALGQFLNYQVALEEQNSDLQLFLAILFGTFKTFFSLPFVQTVVKRFQLSLLVYDPSEEVI